MDCFKTDELWLKKLAVVLGLVILPNVMEANDFLIFVLNKLYLYYTCLSKCSGDWNQKLLPIYRSDKGLFLSSPLEIPDVMKAHNNMWLITSNKKRILNIFMYFSLTIWKLIAMISSPSDSLAISLSFRKMLIKCLDLHANSFACLGIPWEDHRWTTTEWKTKTITCRFHEVVAKVTV